MWKEGEIPTDWKTSFIVPLFKKGDKAKEKNYRGISLLASAYKIYTELLRSRLEEEIEKKGLLPETQAGFRRRRSASHNIFLLNYFAQDAKKEVKKCMQFSWISKKRMTRSIDSNYGRFWGI